MDNAMQGVEEAMRRDILVASLCALLAAAVALTAGCGKKGDISKQSSAAVEASGGNPKADPASMKAKSPFNPGMTRDQMKNAAAGAAQKGGTPPQGGG
jgi:hypothetical protein